MHLLKTIVAPDLCSELGERGGGQREWRENNGEVEWTIGPRIR